MKVSNGIAKYLASSAYFTDLVVIDLVVVLQCIAGQPDNTDIELDELNSVASGEEYCPPEKNGETGDESSSESEGEEDSGIEGRRAKNNKKIKKGKSGPGRHDIMAVRQVPTNVQHNKLRSFFYKTPTYLLTDLCLS